MTEVGHKKNTARQPEKPLDLYPLPGVFFGSLAVASTLRGCRPRGWHSNSLGTTKSNKSQDWFDDQNMHFAIFTHGFEWKESTPSCQLPAPRKRNAGRGVGGFGDMRVWQRLPKAIWRNKETAQYHEHLEFQRRGTLFKVDWIMGTPYPRELLGVSSVVLECS